MSGSRGFAEALDAGPVVLDGGLGTLLEQRGNDLSSTLWSARLLHEDPDEIRAAHAAYFAAGARVAISSSYQVGYGPLAAQGLDRDAVDALLRRSVELARQARDDAGLSPSDAWVAASVGPYGATRADGSEYTGAYDLSVDQLRSWHRPRLQALAAAAPDVLAVETLPSLAEVEAVAAELDDIGMPAWISVTIAGDALRSGDPLVAAARVAASVDSVVAVGVNCCDARDVVGAARMLRRETDLPIVAYPNSGEHWDARTRSWSGAHDDVARFADEWLDAGVRLIGGCCRVGLAQIAELARNERLRPE